jgi:DNA modification methylase
MLVDESTIMLDPTCGSGNSVKVAEELGASYSLGIEMNADYVERAKQNLDL